MFYQKTVKYFLIFSFFGLLFFSSNLNAEISVESEWARVTPSGTGSVYMEIKNNGNSDDDNGVFLTEVDLFFASKPAGQEPLTVDIRTVELGIPTLNGIGQPKTLLPSDITTSKDGQTATRVTFDQPIYLPPGQEYAIVLLAPNTDQYEVWTGKMGEKTIETANLPRAGKLRIRTCKNNSGNWNCKPCTMTLRADASTVLQIFVPIASVLCRPHGE